MKGNSINMTKTYHKLVRDRIPDIIKESGKECSYVILEADGDYIEAIENKLIEEVNEYLKEPSLSELSDVLAVVYGIAQARNWSLEDLENERVSKENKNGSFDKKVFLLEVN